MPETSQLASALGLGLASSLTVCTMACLPLIGTWVLGNRQQPATGLRETGLFLLGRWSAYILMGTLVGAGLAPWLTAAWWQTLAGVLLMASGWRLGRSSSMACAAVHRVLPAWQLGFAQALTPCLPLTSLLALCGLAGSGWHGGLLAAAFGAGAMISPLLLVVPVIAGAGQSLASHFQAGLPWLRWSAAGILMILGIKQLVLVRMALN